jgi:cytochrome b561-like protein
VRWFVAAVAVLLGGVAASAILGQASSGAQPWDSELSDNFVFAKSIPFVLGLGVVAGLLRGPARSTERRADGAVRRFSPWTVVMHGAIIVGILLALPTGAWQYFGGILDVTAPFPLFWSYRVHYIGAAIVLFAIAAFLTAWWVTGDRSLLVPRGAWTGHLRGLVSELPPTIGKRVAAILRVDLRLRPPAPGRFSFYEVAFSFPTWAFVLGLITITGLVKALRYVFPVPGPVLYVASTLHVFAMVLIAAKVLDHLRYTLARWPLVIAIATGWSKDGIAGPASATSPASSPASAGGDE